MATDGALTMHGVLGTALPVARRELPSWHRDALDRDAVSSTKKRQRLASPSTHRKSKLYPSGRFIPLRSAIDLEFCHYAVSEASDDSASPWSSPSAGVFPSEADQRARHYQDALALNLLSSSASKGPLLPCRRSAWTASAAERPHRSLRRVGRNMSPAFGPESPAVVRARRPRRHIPSIPSRILDAPELRDDYYLNLVSWGDNNLVAVALGQVVYVYDPSSGAIHELRACSAPGDYVTSVAWVTGGSGAINRDQLAVGTFLADLQVWDAVALTKLRTLRGHRERIGALSWAGSALSSGSRDTKILHHDLRSGARGGVVAALVGHQQEICGLAWSPDAATLASGGNDNCLCLWDARTLGRRSAVAATATAMTTTAPRDKLCAHQAAVKALAWCPWERNLLASGGGTADRTIKFWNGATAQLLRSVATGSQVCGLVWSKTERELLSSHGFSQNELCLWQYPSMARLREFTGHTARVLHLAMSPDGRSVVSAAADETLRFWDVFASSSSAATAACSTPTRATPALLDALASPSCTVIR